MSHRFKIDDRVRISSSLPLRELIGREFKILRQLPERGGEAQYRVKSASEPFERVVGENSVEKI